MATLEKIRSKAGLLIIVVGVALFAFIIGDFLNSGSTYFRQNQEKIASVNGEVISIQDYQARIDEMIEVYKMQTGNSNMQEEVLTQLRQTVFDSMVNEIVLDEQVDKLGMTISSEELFDMVQGENISQVVQQMPMFRNEQTGMFDKVALLNFLKSIDEDNIAGYPVEQQGQLRQFRQYWLFWEKNIKRQRLEEKYINLLSRAVGVNTLDAKDNYVSVGESSHFNYAMQNYSTIADSLVKVSKSEVEKVYNQRKENYKQQESKVVNYIAVDIVPSTEDFDKAQREIESIKGEFETSANVAELVNEYSDIPYMNVFFSEKSLDADKKEFVATAEKGSVHGPVFSDNKYKLFKLEAKTVGADSVKVSMILLRAASEAETDALTDSLVNVLKKGADFAEIARQYSMAQDAENGGDYGWMTEDMALGMLNEEFKNAVFSASLNELKTLKNMYGSFIFKVTEKTANINKYKIAEIQMSVSPSSKTYSNLYNELNQYISTNNTIAKFDEKAQEAGYNLVKDVTVAKNDESLGFMSKTRPVIRWAFQASKGTVSDIFECEDKFIVAVLQGTIPEGYRSLANVTPAIEAELIGKKKGEMIVNELKSKNITTMDGYAQAMGTSVQDVKFMNFSTARIAGIGIEPKLNAYVTVAPVGEISQPVIGNNGVYVFEVTGRTPAEGEYDEKAQIESMTASNQYRYGYQAIQALRGEAEIIDNRIRFY